MRLTFVLMKIMIEDKRKITKLYFPDDSYTNILPPDSIEAYHENGEMASVVWFAIIKNGNVVSRINSKYVQEVIYE